MKFVVVLDTNILISAAISPTGLPFQCLDLARKDEIQTVTCRELLQEYRRKLEFKLDYPSDRAQKAIEEIEKVSRIIEIPLTLKGVTTDPKDDMVIECAVVGKATHIVTGARRHLLPLKEYKGIAIVSASDFLARFKQDE